MSKKPIKRYVHFHGILKEKFRSKPLEIHADSMFNLFNILVQAYPDVVKQQGVKIAFEDEEGNLTDLFDPEQELDSKQTKVHLIPNTDGAVIGLDDAIYIIIMIIAVGAAILLAPKIESEQDTASGANWTTPENVVGQGGIIPVILGELLVGSRVASYGIDSTVFKGKPL